MPRFGRPGGKPAKRRPSGNGRPADVHVGCMSPAPTAEQHQGVRGRGSRHCGQGTGQGLAPSLPAVTPGATGSEVPGRCCGRGGSSADSHPQAKPGHGASRLRRHFPVRRARGSPRMCVLNAGFGRESAGAAHGKEREPGSPRACARGLWKRLGHPAPSLPGPVPWRRGSQKACPRDRRASAGSQRACFGSQRATRPACGP